MENPATWNRATQVIQDALAEVDRQRRTQMCGLSPARIINDALEKESLLVTPPIEEEMTTFRDKVEALREKALKAETWPGTVWRDSCAACEKKGESEWQVDNIEEGYHAMFGDENQARYIAAASPDFIIELCNRILAEGKGD